jgi:nucleoid-associated protein YgaU
MGIFDFIKSAGKKLGIGGDDDAPEADAVKKELDSFGLGTDKVDVKVDGDKVVLSGVVEDQSIFEKAIVAVGNTLGISKVEASELKVVLPESGLKLGDTDMTALVAASTPANEPKFHTVQKGDNLWKDRRSRLWQGQGLANTR